MRSPAIITPLPNTVTPLVIFATFQMAELLLMESALAFLGLGVQPPTPSWGSMIADGRQYLFFQGNRDNGKSWYLSKVEIGWKDGKPVVLPTPGPSRPE